MRRIIYSFLLVLIAATATVQAQDQIIRQFEQQGYRLDTTVVETRDTIIDKQVVTNPFWHNVFFTANGGAHSFRGDFSDYGPLKETLSYHWFAGIGKWFTPVTGIKLLFGMGKSLGFMDQQYPTPYCYGNLINGDKGSYWKTKNNWWEVSANGMVNLSRSIMGYEGPNSKKLSNQFMLNFGIGYVHHIGMNEEDFTDDDWSGRLELQYSRFFSKKKNLSLDIKGELLAYQTNFDNHTNHNGSKQWDANLGASVGVTFYLKHYDWGYNAKTQYTTNYLTHTIVREQTSAPDYGQLTFYVFYPNNYSGRNDAPIVPTSSVNAIDYLAGGIYTQKQFKDNGMVAMAISSNKQPVGMDYVDMPTIKANSDASMDGLARGYEISMKPLSFSFKNDSLVEFRGKYGYYYSPIWDGKHLWHYRIDDATKGQTLSDASNYQETESYGLNSRLGESIVRQHLADSATELYSFADVYASLEGNSGYISQYVDVDNVARLSRIFNEGIITNISVTGVATSQDNNADESVGFTRNTSLAQNRAKTVMSWLKDSHYKCLSEAQSHIYMVNSLSGPVREVSDSSTRSINAKLNRCVKVTIHYMIMK